MKLLHDMLGLGSCPCSMGELAFVARPDANTLTARAREMMNNGAWREILKGLTWTIQNQYSSYPWNLYTKRVPRWPNYYVAWLDEAVVNDAKSVQTYFTQLDAWKKYEEERSKQQGEAELALQKKLDELSLANELAQAEVTQARVKSQQMADQLKQAILQAQLKQEELKLQESLNIKMKADIEAEKKAEEEAKKALKKKRIKQAGIATAVATGAYMFLS